MNLWPQALQTKHSVVIVDCAPWRELMGQHTPRAASPVEIQNGVDQLLHVHRSGSAAGLGCWNQRFYELPLLIRQVTWIWSPFHILLYRLKTSKIVTFHTRSKRPVGKSTE